MSKVQEHAVERAGRFYAYLKDLARMKEPCPTNEQIQKRFGGSKNTGPNMLNFLEANGMITIERVSRVKRIIHITATGHSTV